MSKIGIINILLSIVISLLPLISSAQPMSKKMSDVFNATCVKTWMEKSKNISDPVAFKDFGEKYCNCASTKSLNNNAEMDQAARECVAQTLLQTAMSTVEDQQGLQNLTMGQIESSCEDQWNLIYPNMNSNVKKSATAYCQCASPKLLDLTKVQNKITDKEYNDKINSIATACNNSILKANSNTETTVTTTK